MTYDLQTLFSIYNNFLSSPNKVAIVCDDSSYSYKDLWISIESIRKTISDKYIENSYIVVSSNITFNFIVGIYGVIYSGNIAVPIDGSSSLSGKTNKFFSYLLSDHQDIANNFYDLEYIEMNLKDSLDSPIELVDKLNPSGPVLVIHSSGTTGTRKAVILSYQAINETSISLIKYSKMKNNIVELVASSFLHAFSFLRLNCVLSVGGTAVLDIKSQEPYKSIYSLHSYNCNSISGVSTYFNILLKYFKDDLTQLKKSIKWIEVGSMKMSYENKKKLISLFPEAIIIMNYGMTEVMRATILNLENNNSLSSSGAVRDNNQINICDENGNNLPPNTPGEIYLKATNMATGYVGQENLWKERNVDGWFRTGDIGTLDNNNNLNFIGRIDDIVNIGGYKYSLIDIEQNFEKLMFIEDFSIVAIEDPSQIYGQILILCLHDRYKNSLNISKLKNQIFNELPNIPLPKLIYFIKKIPKTSSGKVLRNQIIESIDYDDLKTF